MNAKLIEDIGKRLFWMLTLFLMAQASYYAQTTFSKENSPGLSKMPERKLTKHKVLLIPFEPRMYMSQIDHRINAETNWDQKKIKESIRLGLDEELYKCIKKKMEVVSFLDNPEKYQKDLTHTYTIVQYKYDKIPDQAKYEAPKTEKEKRYIQKGQLTAESDNEGKFMNAKMRDNAILSEFQARYKTDVFLLINQVDLFSSEMPGSLNVHSYRTATVHYTILNSAGKEINSGISSVDFPVSVNHPDKIASSYFSKIAEEIVARMEKQLSPPAK